MAKYRFTKKAVDDLTRIWIYTFNKWSEYQADTYYSMLIESCKEIAASPNLGKPYSGIRKGLFGLKAGRHLIFYRKINQDEVEITRILHGRMDLGRRISE